MELSRVGEGDLFVGRFKPHSNAWMFDGGAAGVGEGERLG